MTYNADTLHIAKYFKLLFQSIFVSLEIESAHKYSLVGISSLCVLIIEWMPYKRQTVYCEIARTYNRE